MYCSHCGKQIAANSQFCPSCGAPAAVQEPADGLSVLVERARAGEQDAVAALYEKTYGQVFYTVKSMIKDEDAVFDILQDSYIKAFSHLDRLEGNTRFLPWVKQIAANTARDWLKKKRPLLFAELAAEDGPETPAESLTEGTAQTGDYRGGLGLMADGNAGYGS